MMNPSGKILRTLKGNAMALLPWPGSGPVQINLPEQQFGWHYLFKYTCITRPHVLYALFIVSRIIIVCYMIRHG